MLGATHGRGFMEMNCQFPVVYGPTPVLLADPIHIATLTVVGEAVPQSRSTHNYSTFHHLAAAVS